MPSSPEDRLAKALWGKPELMYDRRQQKSRRTSWRGGRRATDWPDAFSTSHRKQGDGKRDSKRLM